MYVDFTVNFVASFLLLFFQCHYAYLDHYSEIRGLYLMKCSKMYVDHKVAPNKKRENNLGK